MLNPAPRLPGPTWPFFPFDVRKASAQAEAKMLILDTAIIDHPIHVTNPRKHVIGIFTNFTYMHGWLFCGKLVGKYSIHGCYGYGHILNAEKL